MNVLCACEESQVVCLAFREKGHRAFSCDIEPCSGDRPEWHVQGDVLPLINGDCTFTTVGGFQHTIIGQWDLLIAFPPCTHLTTAGASKWKEKQADGRQQAAVTFFMAMINADCERIAVENPQGWMNTHYRKPDQVTQPWMFGDEAQKRTCWWLKGLPLLQPTEIVARGEMYQVTRKSGPRKGQTYSAPVWYPKRFIDRSEETRSRIRSKTFPGIARAMAEQWV